MGWLCRYDNLDGFLYDEGHQKIAYYKYRRMFAICSLWFFVRILSCHYYQCFHLIGKLLLSFYQKRLISKQTFRVQIEPQKAIF